MRILFSCLPLYGHFHPLVPFARAAAHAGHEVAFAARAAFAPAVQQAGFRHFATGLDQPSGTIYPQLSQMSADEAVPFVNREIFAGLIPTYKVPDLLALAATWPPGVIVRDENDYSGCLAAERLGLPHAAVAVLAAGDRPYIDVVAGPLDRHRAALGLAPDPALAMLHRYLTLRPFPPSFRDPATTLPPTAHHVRPTPDDRSGAEGLPEWVAALPDRPVVYLGLGTVYAPAEVFRAIIAGLRDADLTLIVTVGREQDPTDYGPQPPNVHIERYIPLSLLLQHCDLVVTNGGSGTLMAALAHGLPLVVVPINADQPNNAARCAALDLGHVVLPDALTPEVARQAVLAVLGNPGYRAAAGQMRAEMATLPGPERAVALFERLAVERQPITATG